MPSESSIDSRTPVLVGCGQITDTASVPGSTRSPSEFVAEAVRAALADTRAARGPKAVAAAIDSLATLRFFSDSSPRFTLPFGRSTNPPKGIAQRIGASPRQLIYTDVGGNLPQSLASLFAERIAAGEIDVAVICGGELLRSSHLAQRQNLALDWNEDPGGEPEHYGDARLGWSEIEAKQGLMAAIYFYPLIENAIRAAAGRRVPDHVKTMAGLFARFAAVAKDNPLATRREGFSAERLAAIDADNRWIVFPYPRLMNSNAFVDQAAAFVMMSVAKARALGVPEDRYVYLHGCAEAADRWHVSERSELHRSPAIHAVSRHALDMAGKRLEGVDCFDLYSCFPSAVRIALEEIGLQEDDPRGLTLTGGLPYFGGPGNNYVTHSIAEAMNRVRTTPGSFAMVTANGSYVTKHAAGIYSSTPTRGSWRREPPKALQASLDKLPWIEVDPAPQGAGVIETYAVGFDKDQPSRGVVIGRVHASGQRFVANTPPDPALLADMMNREQVGRTGTLSHDGKRTTFLPD
jgi:acetyl-CoA C-acetyltransferase